MHPGRSWNDVPWFAVNLQRTEPGPHLPPGRLSPHIMRACITHSMNVTLLWFEMVPQNVSPQDEKAELPGDTEDLTERAAEGVSGIVELRLPWSQATPSLSDDEEGM